MYCGLAKSTADLEILGTFDMAKILQVGSEFSCWIHLHITYGIKKKHKQTRA